MSMIVCPSHARARVSEASVPPAPGRFSTTTGWPSVAASDGAISRATISVVPPAPKP